MLITSLIIIIISFIIALVIDKSLDKKPVQKIEPRKQFYYDEEGNLCEHEQNEVDQTINAEIEYKQNCKTGIVAFAFYYALNLILSVVLQVIFHNILINELGITNDQLLEGDPNFSSEAYAQYEVLLTAYLNFVIMAVVFIGFIFIFKNILKDDFKTFKGDPKKYLGLFGLGFVGMYISNFLVSFIITLFFGDDVVSSNQDLLNGIFNHNDTTKIILIIFTVIFAPFIEELLFRKSIFNFFKKKSFVPIIVSAVIFAFIHVSGPMFSTFLLTLNNEASLKDVFIEFAYIGIYLPPAFVLAYVYSESKYNIFPCILIHTAQNLLSVIGMFIYQ